MLRIQCVKPLWPRASFTEASSFRKASFSAQTGAQQKPFLSQRVHAQASISQQNGKTGESKRRAFLDTATSVICRLPDSNSRLSSFGRAVYLCFPDSLLSHLHTVARYHTQPTRATCILSPPGSAFPAWDLRVVYRRNLVLWHSNDGVSCGFFLAFHLDPFLSGFVVNGVSRAARRS